MAVDKYLNQDGLSHVADYVNRKLTVVSSMPSSPTDLRTVLYVGATTEDYIQGGIYIYDEPNDEWIFISAIDVNLYETSWTGTQAEWAALTEDEQAKYEIVNFTDDFDPSMYDYIIKGYYYEGKFYEENTHTTEIEPSVNNIYIDIPTNYIYRYDSSETEYIQIGGGEAITYVDVLPSAPDIEDKIYGQIEKESFPNYNYSLVAKNTRIVTWDETEEAYLPVNGLYTSTLDITKFAPLEDDPDGYTWLVTAIKKSDGQPSIEKTNDDYVTTFTTDTDVYSFYAGDKANQILKDISGLDLRYLTAADIDDLMNSVAGSQWDYLADVIVDGATSTQKVWSSNKITTELTATLDASKTYTDQQISRFRSTSYYLVTSTAEMTNPSVLYLLPIQGEEDSYEIYALIKDSSDQYVPTAIGTTAAALDDYYTKEEADLLFVKGTDVITKTKYGNEIGDVSMLETIAPDVVGAINELKEITDTFETVNIDWSN